MFCRYRFKHSLKSKEFPVRLPILYSQLLEHIILNHFSGTPSTMKRHIRTPQCERDHTFKYLSFQLRGFVDGEELDLYDTIDSPVEVIMKREPGETMRPLDGCDDDNSKMDAWVEHCEAEWYCSMQEVFREEHADIPRAAKGIPLSAMRMVTETDTNSKAMRLPDGRLVTMNNETDEDWLLKD